MVGQRSGRHLIARTAARHARMIRGLVGNVASDALNSIMESGTTAMRHQRNAVDLDITRTFEGFRLEHQPMQSFATSTGTGE